MTAPTAFGRVLPLNKVWLSKLAPEEVIEPDLPIVDTHHHLWAALPAALPQGDGKEDHTYLLEQFAQDVDSSHHTLATVYVECHNAYRDSGPAAFKPVPTSTTLSAAPRPQLMPALTAPPTAASPTAFQLNDSCTPSAMPVT